ncbi:hypothetical protein F5141DRAFT_1218599 [Pisolithus sp. B1]|nr:hypothetical protein F5141DRAFT_1218599 [Pisolithus sp. B1]
MYLRQPYQGTTRKLILAFDVGTTFSGISYCILDPGDIPEIRGVSKFPGQEDVAGDNKIPSIIYYDKEDKVRAVGAETQRPDIIEEARREQWKLHLRSKHLEDSHFSDADLPPLPDGKSAVEVLGDFMRYLFKCAKEYITEAHAPILWDSLERGIEFILTHPNGWEGPQQQQIRNAAELAGLIVGEEGQQRIHLLTEGEASLHFCVTNVLASDAFSTTPIVCADEPEETQEVPDDQDKGVTVIDAGGGTIDLSAYSMQLSPTSFLEIAPAECRLQGSVFITFRAHAFLRAMLANSNYGDEETLQRMADIFDKTTKLHFRKADEPPYIQFGGVRDRDLEYNIRSGQLKFEDVAKLFEPSVEEISATFEQQRRAASTPITSVFLVGGFAASDWLYTCLVERMSSLGLTICRPKQHVNKAVADGAVSFYIDRLVSGRVARFTYGTGCNVTYNQSDPEHVSRRDIAFDGFSGGLEVPYGFEPILNKGTQVSEQQEFRKSFILEETDRSRCSNLHVDIIAYRGKLANPRWMDTEEGSYTHMCTIRADTSKLAPLMQSHQLSGGAVYYSMWIEVIILFGLTELRAQISWKENNVEVSPGTPLKKLQRYPAQEHLGGDNKIPSILYYDQQHVVRAAGAEALQEHVIEQAEDDSWVKVEWWKLHLRAKNLPSSHIKDDDIPPLPEGLDAVRVLSDFMKYLFHCTRTYIVESHASGSDMWKSLEGHVEFVLTHPNGWEGRQQQQIRQAAKLAGLVPEGPDGQSRLHLLTEGEASLHFCVTTLFASDSFSTPIACTDDYDEEDATPGYEGIAILDAGGGTVDMSVYSMSRLQGSVFVTLRAQQLLKSKLANSQFGTAEMIQQMTKIFDKTTKLGFRNAEDPQYIKFGTRRDSDPEFGIKSGQLKLAGEDIAKLFEPSIEAIAEAFKQQRQASAIPISHAFLVGGYASSDFLFLSLQRHLAFSNTILCRPGTQLNKAVADGAVSFYIDHLVKTRVAKVTYGTPVAIRYDSSRLDHIARKKTKILSLSGHWMLPNSFGSILKKGTRVSEEQESRLRICKLGESASGCSHITSRIHAYNGDLSDAIWMDEELVYADTSKAADALSPQTAPSGDEFYRIDYDVVLLFGLTELKAHICWMENGVEMRYDPTFDLVFPLLPLAVLTPTSEPSADTGSSEINLRVMTYPIAKGAALTQPRDLLDHY